jgi:hypothetical protein
MYLFVTGSKDIPRMKLSLHVHLIVKIFCASLNTDYLHYNIPVTFLATTSMMSPNYSHLIPLKIYFNIIL